MARSKLGIGRERDDGRGGGNRRSAQGAGRWRRGTSGRAHGGQDRGGAVHHPQHPQFRGAERGSDRDHRGQCGDRAGRDRRQFRRQPRGAGPLAGGRRGRERRAGAYPARSGTQTVLHGPVELYAACTQPGAQRGNRRQVAGAGAGLWPPVRARCRWRAALCHDGGFPQVREAGLHVQVAAPFRRHGLRADRHRGQQAASGHADGAHDAERQAVHGLGHRTGTGRGQRGDVQDPVRRGLCGSERGDDLADQRQLAADLRFGDDGGAGGLCEGRAGLHRVALHRGVARWRRSRSRAR